MTEQRKTFLLKGLVLWAGAMLGAVLVVPYTLALAPNSVETAAERLGVTPAAVLAISIAQSAVVMAIATFSGLWAASRLGLDAPLIDAILRRVALPAETRRASVQAAVLGSLAGVLILALDVGLFAGVIEAAKPEGLRPISAWKGLLASFYGGISEEVLLRLFLLSFLALGLRFIVRLFGGAGDSQLPPRVFWAANILAAILFGLAHLPATAELVAITPLIVLRAVLLNGIVGILAGWLFYRRGIEMAMLCHFAADIVLHVLAPLAP